MRIEIKCYATLSRFTPPDADRFEVAEGATVAQIMDRLGLAAEEVKLIFINGAKSDPGTRLAQGDRLGLFPAVGGG